jgi:hypothetical protein
MLGFNFPGFVSKNPQLPPHTQASLRKSCGWKVLEIFVSGPLCDICLAPRLVKEHVAGPDKPGIADADNAMLGRECDDGEKFHGS